MVLRVSCRVLAILDYGLAIQLNIEWALCSNGALDGTALMRVDWTEHLQDC